MKSAAHFDQIVLASLLLVLTLLVPADCAICQDSSITPLKVKKEILILLIETVKSDPFHLSSGGLAGTTSEFLDSDCGSIVYDKSADPDLPGRLAKLIQETLNKQGLELVIKSEVKGGNQSIEILPENGTRNPVIKIDGQEWLYPNPALPTLTYQLTFSIFAGRPLSR